MKYLLLILIGLCLTFHSFGQIDTTTKKFHLWISAGEGVSYSDKLHGLITGRLAINSSIRQKYFFTFYYNECFTFDGFFSKATPNIVTWIQNGSVLFGLGKYKYKSLAFIASTGISYGRAHYRGNLLDSTQGGFTGISPTYYIYNFEHDNYYFVGLPLNFKILFTSPIAGLSLDLFSNFHKHPDFGLILSINIGVIRDQKKY